jgi:hypothetical protein
MKLLANENFPKASVLLLRSFGYDITSISEDNPSISNFSTPDPWKDSVQVSDTTGAAQRSLASSQKN